MQDIDDNKNINEEEKEEKNKKPPFIIILFLTSFAVLAALGLSFSAISLLSSNETINSIISKKKGEDNPDNYIITVYENVGTQNKGINLTKQFPTPDETGKLFNGNNYVYNFSIIMGSGTKDYYYEITAVPLSGNTLDSKYIKLYLQKNNQDISFSYNNKNRVKVYDEYSNSNYSEAVGKVIYKGNFTSEDIQKGRIDFTLRMWVSEDAPYTDEIFNKTFSTKINTYVSEKNG